MIEPQPPCDTPFVPRKTSQPRGATPACLVHIHPPGPGLACRYPLAERPLRIGRGGECDVRPDEPSVSRFHARIDSTDGGHTVADLGSTNGTYVNDEPVGRARQLHDGDYLRVGECIYRYLAGGNLEAEYHEEIYRLTIEDGLTRLANRRALDEFLEREVVRSQRHNRPLSVALIDVDCFKAFNDTHGHLCGDLVLRGVADLLRPLVRREDLCARYGGEEFALVLAEADHDAALAAAERARAAVAGHAFHIDGVTLSVTVSAGVATTCGDAAATPDGLLREADGRLYAAKRAGRNRVFGAASPAGACVAT